MNWAAVLFVSALAAVPNAQTAQKAAPPAPKRAPTPAEQHQKQVVAKLKQTAELVPKSDGTNDFTRAFVFANIGEALLRSDAGTAKLILQRSLDASTAPEIEADDAADFQRDVLQVLFHADADSAVSFAEAHPSRPEFRESVIRLMIEKDMNRAVQMLLRWPSDAPFFAHDAALQVFKKLPPDDPRGEQVFQAAAAGYDRQGDRRSFFADSQFSKLLVAAADRLPSAEVLYWIDRVLSDAKGESGQRPVHSVGESNSVAFNSMYEYRLAQLLPVLRRLAPERAQQLERETRLSEESVAAASDQYGNVSTDDTPAQAAISAQRENLQASLSQTLESRARTEPRRALADSESLPLDLKAQVATSVIMSNMKTNPGVAQDAARSLLSATQGLVEQWPDDGTVLSVLSYAVQLPQWGKRSPEMLKLWCKAMPKIATTLYKHDSDAETPNLAPEVYWPSTVIQLTLISKCAKAGVETKRLLADIDDPAIRLLARTLQLREEISQPQGAWLLQCKVSRKNTTTMAVCE